MNYSDSERIIYILENLNFRQSSLEKADLLIINMCSVRQSAVDRIYFKTKDLKQKTILTGCILNKDKRKFRKYFDYILPINDLIKLPSILNQLGFQTKKLKELNDYLQIPPAHQSKTTASIPIMTGCNNFCSYCVVPYTRGREISRPSKDIIKEAKDSIQKGIKEIWLLGQNVNSYKGNLTFSQLLKEINKIPGDFWIKFTSSHPKDLTNELVERMATSQKICPYINLPIQSGDNKILKSMNRPYTTKKYTKLINKLRKEFKEHRKGLEKELAISTDVIVGFPNETEQQFNNTKNLFKEIKFCTAYISRYSPRPQTSAYQLKDNVRNTEKKKREKELEKIIKDTTLQFNKKFLNKTIDILINKKTKEYYLGKSRHNQTIKIKTKKDILNKIVQTKITKALAFGLEGELISKPKILAIIGPTSSGKSGLAVDLAKKFNGEIISVDSRQVYKGMDIGTGKITKKEMKGIPHHLLDVVSPKTRFTVAQYQKKANKTIKEILKRNKLPILCGGTGFYLQSVIDGITIPKVKPDWNLRKQLEKKSNQQLFNQLKKLDSERAKFIDKNNKRRLIRAIEISKSLKKPIPPIKKQGEYDCLIIGIKKEKNELKNLIHKRLIKRLKQGMIKEVKELKKSSISWKRLEEFGLEYRHISFYLQNKISYQEMVEQLEKEIVRYSKRQMTWFKKDKRINWIENKGGPRSY